MKADVKQRALYISGSLLLLALTTLMIWQGSFHFGSFEPQGAEQVWVLWGVSTLIFLLSVTLGFMLFRAGVKLWMEKQENREGSRIRTRLVVSALGLTMLPVIFLMLFSWLVLNRNLDKWFSRPAERVRINLIETALSMEEESKARARLQARLLAEAPATAEAAAGATLGAEAWSGLCRSREITAAWLERKGGEVTLCTPSAGAGTTVEAREAGPNGTKIRVQVRMNLDMQRQHAGLVRAITDYEEIRKRSKDIRNLYVGLMILITLFVLYVAAWLALLLSRQLARPVAALLVAAREIRTGNLGYRVVTSAFDEMATLVRTFNEMTQDLEANARELEHRRRFTEAILENIPIGVISLDVEGRILRRNPAIGRIFPNTGDVEMTRLEDLFSREDADEIRYLMKRARRTGIASRALDVEREGQTLHLALTLSPLENRSNSGIVLLVEDTSELLRAQKSVAWHEVARRVAHELKNPLTPIGLSSERIARMIDRGSIAPEAARVVRECTDTINREVESVRNLLDAFSQLARFPASEPVPSNMNQIVENALAVFDGRLEGVEIRRRLDGQLPMVMVDPEHFKRVLVNLIDNAAEAMQNAPVRRLFLSTTLAAPDVVEIVVSDTGHGVSREDREKLFLPYFSTRNRGTGLGLAIVNHILMEHGADIRVEENEPRGARFVIELPVRQSMGAKTEATALA
jgi:two-component system, NtrC family, nitrogen regulation sensor histidine kinase NtrY